MEVHPKDCGKNAKCKNKLCRRVSPRLCPGKIINKFFSSCTLQNKIEGKTAILCYSLMMNFRQQSTKNYPAC